MNKSLVVKILATGPTGRGTSVTTEDGKEIKGIKSLSVTLHPLHSNVATIELFTNDVEAEAKAEFQMIHPGTGKMTKLNHIEFEDGSVWPPLPKFKVDLEKLKYLMTRCDQKQPKTRDPFRYYICTRDRGHDGPCATELRDRRNDNCNKRQGILGVSCTLPYGHVGACVGTAKCECFDTYEVGSGRLCPIHKI